MSAQEGKRSTWVEYYRDVALCVSMRSKDPSLQVGCVIVHPKSLRILSAGYNKFPPGTQDLVGNWEKKKKDELVVHAEANAVLLAGQADLEGSIAFVTMYPCRECAKMLIAKGVCKVYYLSLKDKYHEESTPIFKAAKVEVVPIKRGEDATLKDLDEDLIQKVSFVEKQNPIADEQSVSYGELLGKMKALREEDLQSPQPGVLTGKSSLDKWTDYFLFLALIASTRGLSKRQGAILIDSETFKISALSYNGYPRGVSNDEADDSMQVSALTNAVCLRFSEGRDFFAFSTHFPKLHEVKNLAQAQIKRLYFIWPWTFDRDDNTALQIMKEAKMEVVPMDVPRLTKQAIKNTIEGLKNAEARNKLPFSDWPKNTWTEYDLQPERVGQVQACHLL